MVTLVFGIIGYPLGHTLSPLMHNSAFKHLSIDARYVPFEASPDTLKDVIPGLKALGIKGINVTIPYKVKIMKYLDELSRDAQFIGAVNTIAFKSGKSIGYNTDGKGFIASLNEEGDINPSGKKIFILGAGGASIAISTQLCLEGAESITIANRTRDKAENLSERLAKKFPSISIQYMSLKDHALSETVRDADIIVNTTSVGMKPGDPPLINANLIKSTHVVCDIIYNPLKTKLLTEASKKGCSTISGLGMLIHQGAIAFEIWTGKAPPLNVMRNTLVSYLKGRKIP